MRIISGFYANILVILIILGLISPSFSFTQNQEFKQPETFEGVQNMGEKTVVGQKEWLGILEKIWKEEILPIWEKMYDWFKTNIWPKIESWFKREVESRAKEEIEKRKPIIKEEFKKEKEELKEEIPEITKSLWEKFKELIK